MRQVGTCVKEGIVFVRVDVGGGETRADELSYKSARNTNSHQSLAVMEGTQKVDKKLAWIQIQTKTFMLKLVCVYYQLSKRN